MDTAFRPAFIDVSVIADPKISESNLPFGTNLFNQTFMNNYFVGANGHRQTRNEQALFWTAYVAGIYEWLDEDVMPLSPDNDRPTLGDGEFAFAGLTVELANGFDYSTIPMEVLRDMAEQQRNGQDQWTAQEPALVQQIVVVHEIGHQFGLVHPNAQATQENFPDHIMMAPYNDATEDGVPQMEIRFQESDIAKIRNHGGGDNPHP